MRRPLPLLLLGLGSLSLACATVRPPTEQMASSLASVRAAQEAGASELPIASTYLAYARVEADHASSMMRNGRNKEAQLLLERAEADAELALALAQEEPLRAEAQRAHQRLESASP